MPAPLNAGDIIADMAAKTVAVDPEWRSRPTPLPDEVVNWHVNAALKVYVAAQLIAANQYDAEMARQQAL